MPSPRAIQDKASLKLWLESLALLKDEKLRGQLYETVQPLLFSLPANLEQESGASSIASSGIHVDFFQPNPPNVAVETLAQLKPQASGIVPDIRMDVPQLKTARRFCPPVYGAHSYRPQREIYLLYPLR